MTQLFEDIAALAYSVGAFPQLAEKTASAEGSAFANQIGAVGADALYSVITKTAATLMPGAPAHQQVVSLLQKIAAAHQKPPIPKALCHKLAAVVTADEALTEVLGAEGEKTAADYSRLFGMQSFGRQFFSTLLQKAI